MKVKYLFLLVYLFVSMALFLNLRFVHAHPGNTASDGCHYCRTNCDKWGEAWNERHCHNSRVSTLAKEDDNNTTKKGFVEQHPLISLGGAWFAFYGLSRAWELMKDRVSKN